MCGICGILHFEGSSRSVDRTALKRMTDRITHRGPDSDGMYINPEQKLGFGFRRLAIVDLSAAGNQPMTNEDQSIWIVYNGEIYNHEKLRPDLERRGHHYKSRSDTETLLHSYEEYGPSFINNLEGMFAIALWDSNEKELLLFRDRIGIKPLYYAIRNETLIFGSEIKAVLEHPFLSREVDETALSHYFTFITTPAPNTLFKGIFKLEPGHYLRICADGKIEKKRYWSVFDAPVEPLGSEAEISARIIQLLRESIKKRMMSDVPFGVFLSGGIDSSTNVALMSELMDRPVDTFSVAIEGQDDTNEFGYARRIAKQFHTNHHEIVINDSSFIDLFPRVIDHHDEPLADPVSFPLYYVSKLARDNGTIVVQVGEGSDEQFCGYQIYKRVLQAHHSLGIVKALPEQIRKGVYRTIKPWLKLFNYDYRQNFLKNLLIGNEIFLGGAIAFDDDEKRSLLTEGATTSEPLVQRAFSQVSSNDYSAKMIYWELTNRLAELLLMRVDKMTMATSVEARVPFLDHKLVEYSMHIPWNLKIKNGETKYILKKAVEGLIPHDIIYRKKIGFAGSGKNMLTQKIYQHAKPLMIDHRDPYLNPDYIKRLLLEYENSGINYSAQIWTIMNFKMWHKYWIEGESLS